MSLFGKKPTPREQQRQTDRELRKVTRDLDRDKSQLEKEEKKIELEIKKLAKQGNKEGCTILAKQLVQLRKQKTRNLVAGSKVQGIAAQNKNMGANLALTGAMSTTTQTMSKMNQLLKPQQIAQNAKAFQMANTKMEMTDEIINDTLDDILAGSDEEAEMDAVIGRVLDEIGIEVSGAMAKAPTAISNEPKAFTDRDIEAQLAKLRMPPES